MSVGINIVDACTILLVDNTCDFIRLGLNSGSNVSDNVWVWELILSSMGLQIGYDCRENEEDSNLEVVATSAKF